jgi:hypothetical protein
LLPHKQDLFSYLRQRWQVLFDVRFDVLLYDLTSPYFESEPPEEGKRKFGYSRDKRPDLRAGSDCLDRDSPKLSTGL